mmetsp:Transcript_20482/g.18125  ORF Transcript_20482/g.18125 Transcript_20482/m.18125 type:complete len:104 (-) Transcript_20482:22-333(-)
MLESMHSDCLSCISKTFSLPKNQIVAYIHYLPTYFHLHIHYCHQKFIEGFSANIGKCIMLKDVIQNIKIKGNYYQEVVLTVGVGTKDKLYAKLEEAGYVNGLD